ncbi:SDR family NAD(P)-dependent oxidoreductase [Nannocystaceae bacterium ST9]
MSKVVLVTGCRSGFGFETAMLAANEGHRVYAGLRDLAGSGEFVRACAGKSIIPLQLDITDASQRKAAIARIADDEGRLDVLVNNAGTALGGFLEQIDEDELRALFEINVFATFAMTQAALPLMRGEQRQSTIVMISSMSGRLAYPGLGAYASSKFAIEGMAEAWRQELREHGVRVVVVEPAMYKTSIFERNRRVGRRVDEPGNPYARRWSEFMRAYVALVDKTAGEPIEVAELILALIEQADPVLRHPIGQGSRAREMLARLAPYSVVEWLIPKVFEHTLRSLSETPRTGIGGRARPTLRRDRA